MTKVLAIDPSTTCLGWAILEKDGKDIKALSYGHYRPKGANHYAKIDDAIGFLTIKAQEERPNALVIEDVINGFYKTGRTSAVLGALDYAITDEFYVNDRFNPKTVKEAVTGKGNASKEDMQKAVTKLIKGVDFYPQEDAADALAIGYTYLMGVK